MTFECKVCGPLLDVDLNDDVELREDGYCKSHSWIFESHGNFKLKKYPDGERAHSISTNCGYCNNEIRGNFVEFDDLNPSPQVMSNEEFSNKFIEYIRDHLTEDFQIPDNLSDMDYEFLWEVIQSICPTSREHDEYFRRMGRPAPVFLQDLNRFFDAYGNELDWRGQFEILTHEDNWRDFRVKFNFIPPGPLSRHSEFMEKFKQRISEYNFSQPREKWSRDQLEFYFALWFFTKFVVKAKGPGNSSRFPLLYITPPFIYHHQNRSFDELELVVKRKWFSNKGELPKWTKSIVELIDDKRELTEEQLSQFQNYIHFTRYNSERGKYKHIFESKDNNPEWSGLIQEKLWHSPSERFDLVTYPSVDFSYTHPSLSFETRGVGDREIGDTREYRKVSVKRKINIQFNKFDYNLVSGSKIPEPYRKYKKLLWQLEYLGIAESKKYVDLWKVQIYPDDWPLRWADDDKYYSIDFEPINQGNGSWRGVVKFHDATFKTGVDNDKTLGRIVCKKCLKNEGQKSPNKKKSAKPQEKHTPLYDDDEDYDDEDEGVNNNSGGRRRFGPGYS